MMIGQMHTSRLTAMRVLNYPQITNHAF